MKLLDSIIKINTLLIGGATLMALAGSPFFGKNASDSSRMFLATESDKEVSAVVAGAYDVAATPTPLPTATPTPTPIPVANPTRIRIPVLNIDTEIVPVGVSDQNVMEVPQDFSQVGWFDKSQKPGQFGTSAAIVTGHFDRVDGSPAVFYNLENLKKDDEIIMTSADNTMYSFRVVDVFSHPLEDFPNDIVYGKVDGAFMKLITCDGVWHADKNSYSDRLVVTTRLDQVVRPKLPSEAI